MSILMGIMAVLMVVVLVSGHGRMSGHEKAQQKQDLTTHDDQKEDHPCDGCPAALEMKNGDYVKDDDSDKNKTDAEVVR